MSHPSILPPSSASIFTEGTTLGDFRLVRKLGEGGFGQVWLAEVLERKVAEEGAEAVCERVALKLMLDSGGDSGCGPLLNEWLTGRASSHPNVVRVMQVGQQGPLWYVSMEYVEGMNLQQVFAALRGGAGALPPMAVLELAEGAASGLGAVHQARDASGRRLGLVHRDVKPANLMIDVHGQVKLLDFGIAKGQSSPQLTDPGLVKGTLFYMSPEQHYGEALGPQADLYALGAVLYEALTGEILFPFKDPTESLRYKRKVPYRHRLDRVDGLVPGLAEVLNRCLARDPVERYPDAQTLFREVRALRLQQAQGPGLLDVMHLLHVGALPPGSPRRGAWLALEELLRRPRAAQPLEPVLGMVRGQIAVMEELLRQVGPLGSGAAGGGLGGGVPGGAGGNPTSWAPRQPDAAGGMRPPAPHVAAGPSPARPALTDEDDLPILSLDEDLVLPAPEALGVRQSLGPTQVVPVAVRPDGVLRAQAPPLVPAKATGPQPAVPEGTSSDLCPAARPPIVGPEALPTPHSGGPRVSAGGGGGPAPASTAAEPPHARPGAPPAAAGQSPAPAAAPPPPPAGGRSVPDGPTLIVSRSQFPPPRPAAAPRPAMQVLSPRGLGGLLESGARRLRAPRRRDLLVLGALVLLAVITLGVGIVRKLAPLGASVSESTAPRAAVGLSEPGGPESTEPGPQPPGGPSLTATVDGDGDGHVVCAPGQTGCDCDDEQEAVHPAATERCDGRDTDCDGVLGPLEGDQDRDGFLACLVEGVAAVGIKVGVDCDDQDPEVYPGAVERSNGVDDNCDGRLAPDEQDDDQDGYTARRDCDDQRANVHPGAEEVPGDGVDNNCNGYERCLIDEDRDGYASDISGDDRVVGSCAAEGAVLGRFEEARCDRSAQMHPGLKELPGDGLDNDCNTATPDGVAPTPRRPKILSATATPKAFKSSRVEVVANLAGADQCEAVYTRYRHGSGSENYAEMQVAGTEARTTVTVTSSTTVMYYGFACVREGGQAPGEPLDGACQGLSCEVSL